MVTCTSWALLLCLCTGNRQRKSSVSLNPALLSPLPARPAPFTSEVVQAQKEQVVTAGSAWCYFTNARLSNSASAAPQLPQQCGYLSPSSRAAFQLSWSIPPTATLAPEVCYCSGAYLRMASSQSSFLSCEMQKTGEPVSHPAVTNQVLGCFPPAAVLKPQRSGSGSLLKVQSGFLAEAEGIRLMPLLPPTPKGPFLQLCSSPSSWSTPTAGLSSPDQLEEGLEARTRTSGHSDTSRTYPKSSSPLVLGPSQKEAPTAPRSSGTDRS